MGRGDPISAGNLDGWRHLLPTGSQMVDPISAGNLDWGMIPYLQATLMGGIAYLQETQMGGGGGSHNCRKPRWRGSHTYRKPDVRSYICVKPGGDPISAGNVDAGDPISAGNLEGGFEGIPYLQET